MPATTTQIVTRVFTSAIPLLNAHWSAFKGSQEEFNIMYPQMAQAVKQEFDGSFGNDTFWIVCDSGVQNEVPDLVLACSESSHGHKLPIFIASSLPIATLSNPDFLIPRLRRLVNALYDELTKPGASGVSRVFSVFAVAPITTAFAEIWTAKTGIAPEPEPYYSATYARCTKQSFRNKQFTILGETTYDLRLAVEKDLDPVAQLCYDFALTSVRKNNPCFSVNVCSHTSFSRLLVRPTQRLARRQSF